MKVWAANDEMAKILKHGITNVGFVDLNTSADWPEDTFTARRIRDGDVLTEAPTAKSNQPSAGKSSGQAG